MAVRPHKPTGPSKPETCPHCGSDYEFRFRGQRDDWSWSAGYRCSAQGYVYVHQGAEHPTGVLPR